MRLIKVDKKWYVNRCTGKISECEEFKAWCKHHQSCKDCIFNNPYLGYKVWEKAESKNIDDSCVMFFVSLLNKA